LSSPLFEYLKVKGFTEDSEEALESQVVDSVDGIIGHLVASVSFGPSGEKMILGPKKDEVRYIDCVPIEDYSDWDTYCLVKVQDHPYDARLLIVRQDQLEKPPIN
jgi:hypothetical protein